MRCVVFDLDGTLVDTGEMFYRIFAEAVRHASLKPLEFKKAGDPWVSARAQTLAKYQDAWSALQKRRRESI